MRKAGGALSEVWPPRPMTRAKRTRVRARVAASATFGTSVRARVAVSAAIARVRAPCPAHSADTLSPLGQRSTLPHREHFVSK